MSSNFSAAKENEEPIHIASNTERAVLPETLDAGATIDEAAAGDIKAANEVTGIKLALIVIALCFSNILTLSYFIHRLPGCCIASIRTHKQPSVAPVNIHPINKLGLLNADLE